MKIRGKQTGGDIIPHNMILYKNTKDQSDLIEENKKYLGSCQVCDIEDNIGNNIEIIRSFLSETVEVINQAMENREKAISMLSTCIAVFTTMLVVYISPYNFNFLVYSRK